MKALLAAGAAAGLLAGTLLSLPLAWGMGSRLSGLDPDAAALGTVWSGHIAHIQGLPPIHTRLRGTEVLVSADGAGLELGGRAGPRGVADLDLRTPVRALGRFDARLAGLAGEVSASDLTLRFADGRCTDGSGKAGTDALGRNSALWGWRGPALSGPVTCEDGAVVVAMSGEEAGAAVDLRVAVDPVGLFTATVLVQTTQPEAAGFLPLLGFSRTGTGYRLENSGRWQ